MLVRDNFRIKSLPEKLISHVRLSDMEDGRHIGDYMHYVFIQTQLFDKKEDECVTGFDIWMYYLKNLKTMQELPFKTRKDSVYERLDRLSRYSVLTEEEKYQYNADLKWARDYNATLNTARREGLAEGEKRARIEMARSAISLGMDTGKICELTKLTPEEVESLRE